MSWVKNILKRSFRFFVPLKIRKHVSKKITKLSWFKLDSKNWWVTELIHDLANKDINEYHKFLWENHLSYAETYNTKRRFGNDNIEKSRIKLFSDMMLNLKRIGVSASTIKSVFEIGCSLGYQLYYLEENFITEAEELVGIDLDSQAIYSGREYLKKLN